jgi:hypothetical protein
MRNQEVLQTLLTKDVLHSADTGARVSTGGSPQPPTYVPEHVTGMIEKGKRELAQEKRDPRFQGVNLDNTPHGKEILLRLRNLDFSTQLNEEKILDAYETNLGEDFLESLLPWERELFQKIANNIVNRYAVRVLNALFVDEGVQPEGLEKRIADLDRKLGTAFQTGDVRTHYDNLRKGVVLWRYGELAASDASVHVPADLPTLTVNKGPKQFTWFDVYFTRDIYGEYMHGKEGASLREIMTRLDKSDNNILYVDRRDGSEVRMVGENTYVRNAGNGKQVAVDSKFVGRAYLSKDNEAVVEKPLPGNKKMYIKRSSLEAAGEQYRRTGRMSPLSEDAIVRANDIVLNHKGEFTPYDRGLTPTEKIAYYSDGDGKSELEVFAQRLADALGEHIKLSDEESRWVYTKRRELNPRMPNTEREEKFVKWGIKHRVLWWAWSPRVGLIEQTGVTALPEAVFDLLQPSEEKGIQIRTYNSNGTPVFTELKHKSDKRGDFATLLGLTWSQMATLGREVLEEYVSSTEINKGVDINPKLVYERADSSFKVVNAALKAVTNHNRVRVEDVATWMDKGSTEPVLANWSAVEAERFALMKKFIRDISPADVADVQLIGDPKTAITEATRKMRANLALEEFIAWKTDPLRIPFELLGGFVGLEAEHRARMLINEVWATDEAIIKDVGYEKWVKTVRGTKDKKEKGYYNVNYDFLGGVGFELWLKNNKLFKADGVVDSTGKSRAATIEEFMKWMGMEVTWDQMDTPRFFKQKDGKIVERQVKIWRRRLKMIGQEQPPKKAGLSDTEYQRQLKEYHRWQRYLNDPNHGIDSEVSQQFSRWMNVGRPPDAVVVGDLDGTAEVMPLFLEQSDLLRDKYKVLDYVMEWVYPGRNWGGRILNAIQNKANHLKPPDATGNPSLQERIKNGHFSSDPVYRWGFVQGRHPLQIWQAYTEMNNGTRTEFVPVVKELAQKNIHIDGSALRPGEKVDPARGDLTLYRIGNQNFIDPVLAKRGLRNKHAGWVTYETLITLPRRDALSIESIEYGGGRYIPKKSVGQGIHRRPVELAKHMLQFKVPWKWVERSYLYQVGLEYQDVVSGMGSEFKAGDPESEAKAWEQVRERWDRMRGSNRVMTIVDAFFSIAELLDQGKINESEFASMCNMAGCWFRFRNEDGGVLKPDGWQGTNFIRVLEQLGIQDKQLEGYMKTRDESLRKRIKEVTGRAGKYFLGPSAIGADILLEVVGDTKAGTARVFGQKVVAPSVIALSGGALSPYLYNLGLSLGNESLIVVSSLLLPAVAFGGFAYAGYHAWRIRSNAPVYGKMKDGKYIKPPLQNVQSYYASIDAQVNGFAAYDYPKDDVVEAVGKLNEELTALYTVPWERYHGITSAA